MANEHDTNISQDQQTDGNLKLNMYLRYQTSTNFLLQNKTHRSLSEEDENLVN